MTRKALLILFLLGLTVASLSAVFQAAPGYMDADYYYAGGVQLAKGNGFQEWFLWNYLDDPVGLPHPSHTYWMPLASIVAWLGMAVLRTTAFHAGQSVFVLLAALLPPLTAILAFRITHNQRLGWLAGLIAVFPGFYLSLLTTVETFSLYMIFGSLFLLVAFRNLTGRIQWWQALIFGLLAALMHLSRADGLLWFIVGLLFVVWSAIQNIEERSWKSTFKLVLADCFLVMAGYLVLIFPWYLRNLSLYGSPFSPGGSLTLWLTNYNETFAFPSSILSFQHWLSSGVGSVLQARLWALGMNLLNLLGSQTSIFLLPLILLGGWTLRRQRIVQFGLLMWLATLLLMTLVFPFAGARGGFLHSGAALQPFLWVLAAAGLDAFIEFGKQKRGWNRKQSSAVFSTALVLFSLFLTVFVYWQRVIGEDIAHPLWSAQWRAYQSIEQTLKDNGAQPDDIVMTVNPPAYFNATGRQAIVVPGGDLSSVVAAAGRYQAKYLILEKDQANLSDLYTGLQVPVSLQRIGESEGIQVYMFQTVEKVGR